MNVSFFEKQLACDYACDVTLIKNKENVFALRKPQAGRRLGDAEESVLKVAVYNGSLLFSSTDAELLAWCKDTYGERDGTWFSDVANLRRLDRELADRGHEIADIHQYYLPSGEAVEVASTPELKWYDAEAIRAFEGDERFDEAFLFSNRIPDILAVAAVEDDEILAMAGATEDSQQFWQIGVNVTDAGRGKGLGNCVVTHLKNAILSRGKVPYYGTVGSHVKSQRVAVRSGFIPIWLELYTQKIK